MDASSPPRYRRFSTRPGPAPTSGSDLPAYTRRNTLTQAINLRRDPTEHIFLAADGKSKPWITLRVFSSAKSSKSLPTFFEKENIDGKLEIDAERGDSIQAITAVVWSCQRFFRAFINHRIGDRPYHHWVECRRLLRLLEPQSAHLVKIFRHASDTFVLAGCL